jgi:WD40 repeat protein
MLAACSAKERSDLLLVNVDLTAVPTTKSMKFSVTSSETQAVLKEQTLATPNLSAGIAKLALTQTDSMNGSVLVTVTALDGNVELGQGTGDPVSVTRGKNAGPVTVTVKAKALASDGGVGDAGADTVGADAQDLGVPDLAGLELGTQADGVSTNKDTYPETDPGVKPDGQLGPDVQTDDTAQTDAPGSADAADALNDGPATEIPQRDLAIETTIVLADAATDAIPDAAPDAGGTILTTLNDCKLYVHYPNSPATCASGSDQERTMVTTVAFTPDGKYLVSGGSNTWVKLWKITDTGLEDTQVVFVGKDSQVTATISPDGNTLALGNSSGDIALYDLKAAIDSGTVTKTSTLSATNLSSTPDGQEDIHTNFTTDGKQLIAMYPSDSSSTDALVAVWDLATLLPIRQFSRNGADMPLAVSNSSSTGPIWVASASTASVDTDAGSSNLTTVTLEDISTSGGAKITFMVPGQAYRIAWSADYKTLAIGTQEGEVGLWDVSNKSNIQRLGSPLIQASSGSNGNADSIYALAYSRDGAFVTAGSWIYHGISKLSVVNLQTRGITIRQLDYEPRSFAFHPDGKTWAYGLGGCGYVYFCKN